jgi:hypothetical protein
MDFIADRLENGRKVRLLTNNDDFSREALLIQVELLFPLLAAVDLGTQVVEWKGNSQRLRTSSQMGAGRIHL